MTYLGMFEIWQTSLCHFFAQKINLHLVPIHSNWTLIPRETSTISKHNLKRCASPMSYVFVCVGIYTLFVLCIFLMLLLFLIMLLPLRLLLWCMVFTNTKRGTSKIRSTTIQYNTSIACIQHSTPNSPLVSITLLLLMCSKHCGIWHSKIFNKEFRHLFCKWKRGLLHFFGQPPYDDVLGPFFSFLVLSREEISHLRWGCLKVGILTMRWLAIV